MKKISIAIGLVLTFALFTGCSDAEVAVSREAEAPSSAPAMQQRADLQLEEMVDMATHVLTAAFSERTSPESDGSYELRFQVGDILKGSYADEEISIHVSPSSQSEGFAFVEGHDYLLLIEEHILRSDEHNRYYLLGDLFIPLDGTVEQLRESDLLSYVADADALMAAGSVAEYVRSLCENSPETEPAGIPYTRTTVLEDVVAASEFVLLVTVGENFIGMTGSDIRYCTVDEIIKGEFPIPEEIVVAFMEDENIVPGYGCCVLVNRADGADSGSSMFAESSPSSVIPLTDTETVQEVRDLVAAQSGAVTE